MSQPLNSIPKVVHEVFHLEQPQVLAAVIYLDGKPENLSNDFSYLVFQGHKAIFNDFSNSVIRHSRLRLDEA